MTVEEIIKEFVLPSTYAKIINIHDSAKISAESKKQILNKHEINIDEIVAKIGHWKFIEEKRSLLDPEINYIVVKFVDHDIFLIGNGYYSSWASPEYDEEWQEGVENTITITEWQAK